MSGGPMPVYRARLTAGDLTADPAQRRAVEKLQLLHNRLTDYSPAAPKLVPRGLFGWGREKIEETGVPGLYLYGGVGRGKSMLMDLFFGEAPVEPKRRVHFHAFMQEAHEGIHAARQTATEDPVRPVADRIAGSATLLCFDEMQISDITDAMLVGRLFERLFERGVVVVATSNRHPDDLYKDGLNRQLFLPFIALIKTRMEVHELGGEADHRLARGAGEIVYHVPADATAHSALDATWATLAGSEPDKPLILQGKGRAVEIARHRRGVARAGFAELCGQPLGPSDYLALAAAVDVLILEEIPIMDRARADEAKRFVTLIDALYEARVRLICSAAAEPEGLYREGAGAFEFGRTASRLQEMRSRDWARAAA